MEKIKLEELVNVISLKKMAESIYAAAGIPIGIIGTDGTIYVAVGWQKICTDFHRANPDTLKRCLESDKYICDHIRDGGYISYKCLNNMWDIASPIVISGLHIATIFFGQFFYEDETVDIEYFRKQAMEFGFDEKEYFEALEGVPVFSRKKVQNIMEYYSELVATLADSGFRRLEYEKSQNALRESKEYINKIYNSVNDAIFFHDLKGQIIDVNYSAVIMTGYSFNELIKMNIDELISKNSAITPADVLRLASESKDGRPLMLEMLLTHKDKREIWIEVNIHSTLIGGNDRVVATVRNIDERKKTELALHNQTKELEKLRTEFFANISHELKTPLNIILGTIQVNELIIGEELTLIDKGRIRNNLNIGKQNCFRLLRLINNLIDSTKLGACDFKLKMNNCNIVSIVEEITLSVAEYINNNNLCLTFDTDVEEKIIACDADKIERIMLNLLSNSVKFTQDGGSIFVNVFDGEDYVTITVEDTGIGIPEDKVNIIFDRFRQVDSSFTRNCEGSGIGLSLVKSLVEMHGGTIEVESTYGEGTKFFVKFPVKVLEEEREEKGSKITENSLNNHVERIRVEFSDIYR